MSHGGPQEEAGVGERIEDIAGHVWPRCQPRTHQSGAAMRHLSAPVARGTHALARRWSSSHSEAAEALCLPVGTVKSPRAEGPREAEGSLESRHDRRIDRLLSQPLAVNLPTWLQRPGDGGSLRTSVSPGPPRGGSVRSGHRPLALLVAWLVADRPAAREVGRVLTARGRHRRLRGADILKLASTPGVRA
jgi:hypothetical protein